MKSYMYILLCGDGSYYTGSTTNLEVRLAQHENGEGANHTHKHLPVKLVYLEEFSRIEDAFYREKQIQGWSRNKKEALIKGDKNKLKELSKNYTQFHLTGSGTPASMPSTGSGTGDIENDSMLPSTGSGTAVENDFYSASPVAEPVEATISHTTPSVAELVEATISHTTPPVAEPVEALPTS